MLLLLCGAAHWIARGLTSFERLLCMCSGRFCFGDSLSLADCVLVPQLFAARRFDVDLSAFPTCLRVEAELISLPAFVAAHPDQQSDKPSTASA